MYFLIEFYLKKLTLLKKLCTIYIYIYIYYIFNEIPGKILSPD
jgi:hypothetical protein